MTTPTTVQVRLQIRADTAANWASVNPVLLANELGLESDTKKFKIGNGSSAWGSLAYFPSIVSGGTVLGNLEIGTTGTLTFEGSTADGFETTLAVANPTADRTITLPDASGTVFLTSGGTLTGDLTLNNQSDLRFADADSSNWVAFQAPATVASNVTWTLPSADGTASQVLSTNGSGTLSWTTPASGAGLDTAQTWTKGQRGEITALTDGATITPDFNDSNNFSVTLGGNRTLANPTNLVAGQSGCIWITQDGTGSRTLAYGSYWDFTGNTAPTLTTTANAVDCLVYAVQSSTKITAQLITNLS